MSEDVFIVIVHFYRAINLHPSKQALVRSCHIFLLVCLNVDEMTQKAWWTNTLYLIKVIIPPINISAV